MVAFFFLYLNCVNIILTTMRHTTNKHYDTNGGLLGHQTNVSSHPKPPVSKEDETMSKYPYQILLENAPDSSELEYQFEIDNADDEIGWWEKMSPEEVIREVEEIRDRYTPGSGWVHSEEIENGGQASIIERNELRKVVAHMKRKYKKHYGGE